MDAIISHPNSNRLKCKNRPGKQAHQQDKSLRTKVFRQTCHDDVISYGNRPIRKRYLRRQGGGYTDLYGQTAAIRDMPQGCETQLFFADVIDDSDRNAVIPLRVGHLIWIVRKSGLFVIELKQTQGPLGLESPLHPSSSSPRKRAARERGLGESRVQRKCKAIVSTPE